MARRAPPARSRPRLALQEEAGGRRAPRPRLLLGEHGELGPQRRVPGELLALEAPLVARLALDDHRQRPLEPRPRRSSYCSSLARMPKPAKTSSPSAPPAAVRHGHEVGAVREGLAARPRPRRSTARTRRAAARAACARRAGGSSRPCRRRSVPRPASARRCGRPRAAGPRLGESRPSKAGVASDCRSDCRSVSSDRREARSRAQPIRGSRQRRRSPKASRNRAISGRTAREHALAILQVVCPENCLLTSRWGRSDRPRINPPAGKATQMDRATLIQAIKERLHPKPYPGLLQTEDSPFDLVLSRRQRPALLRRLRRPRGQRRRRT